MDIEKFVEVLSYKGITYEIKEDKVIITEESSDIYLDAFTTIPPYTEFYNKGDVIWSYVNSLPPGLKFNNKYNVSIKNVRIIPTDVEFNNGGNVNLSSTGIGFINQWKENIKGINPRSLLNAMIKSGLFM